MQVFQTAGEPPKSGKIILAIIGWTQNNSAALTNIVPAKMACMRPRTDVVKHRGDFLTCYFGTPGPNVPEGADMIRSGGLGMAEQLAGVVRDRLPQAAGQHRQKPRQGDLHVDGVFVDVEMAVDRAAGGVGGELQRVAVPVAVQA